jgi:N-sulfoglucosamine sulfohydrolase
MKMKNAVIIIADDWDRISRGYGNPFIHTPNIDRFAERAVTFDHGFCTTPSCAASRASILTGLHSHTHGQYGHCHGDHPFRTKPDARTIPQITHEAGFFTGIVGKSHVAPMEIYPFQFQRIGRLFEPHRIGDDVEAFFEECGSRHFFLHVAFGDPHRRGPAQGFRNDFDIPGFDQPRYSADQVIVPDFLPEEPEVREDLAEYYEAVSRYDYGVGRVLDALRASGREDDTMVIVTNDHGMPFPGAKASPFDTGHRCPFLLYTPEIENRGGRHNALMNWVDIAPTIYDWCGLIAPEGLPGRSLMPVIDEPDCAGWDETFLSHTFHGVMEYTPYRIVRGREFKLVYHVAPGRQCGMATDLYRSKTWQCVLDKKLDMMGKRPTERFLTHESIELYNIVEDPMETENLAGRAEYRDLEESMKRRLFDFCVETGDPWMEYAWQQGFIDKEPRTI